MRLICTFIVLSLSLLAGCDNSPSIDKADISATCGTSGDCPYTGGVVMSLQNDPVRPEQPFNVMLQLPEGVKPKSAYLEGDSMYMGRIPVFFVQHQDKYIAETMVGACTEPSMRWRLMLQVEGEQGVSGPYILYFDSAY